MCCSLSAFNSLVLLHHHRYYCLSFIIFFFFFDILGSSLFTSQIHFLQCCVHFKHFTQCSCAFGSNTIACHSFFLFVFFFLFLFFLPCPLDSVLSRWRSLSAFHSLLLLLHLQCHFLSFIHHSFSFHFSFCFFPTFQIKFLQ